MESSEHPFGAVAARFIAEGLATPYYLDRFNHILPPLGEIPVRDLNQSLLRKYRQERYEERKSLKPATVNRDLSVLRRLCNWTVEEGLIPANPLGRLRLERERRTKRPVMSVREEKILTAHAPLHLQRIILCALDTGMRRGEIFGQRWEDVDFDNRLLHVTHSKTPKANPVSFRSRAACTRCSSRSAGTGAPFSRTTATPSKDRIHRAFSIAAGGAAAFTLLVWGLLRGHQLEFAAGVAGNPLSDFLNAHPVLAAAFFTLITLATPMVGAFAFLWAWRDFSNARTWRRVRERFETLRTAEVELPRKIQAQKEWLAQYDRRREAECRQWKEIFNHYYDRGRKNGARQEPFWSVLWKSALGVIGGTLLVVFFPALGILADCLLPIVPGLGLFLYFNHRRLHPGEERFLKREDTKFVGVPETPRWEAAPQRSEIHLLPKGDNE